MLERVRRGVLSRIFGGRRRVRRHAGGARGGDQGGADTAHGDEDSADGRCHVGSIFGSLRPRVVPRLHGLDGR